MAVFPVKAYPPYKAFTIPIASSACGQSLGIVSGFLFLREKHNENKEGETPLSMCGQWKFPEMFAACDRERAFLFFLFY